MIRREQLTTSACVVAAWTALASLLACDMSARAAGNSTGDSSSAISEKAKPATAPAGRSAQASSGPSAKTRTSAPAKPTTTSNASPAKHDTKPIAKVEAKNKTDAKNKVDAKKTPAAPTGGRTAAGGQTAAGGHAAVKTAGAAKGSAGAKPAAASKATDAKPGPAKTNGAAKTVLAPPSRPATVPSRRSAEPQVAGRTAGSPLPLTPVTYAIPAAAPAVATRAHVPLAMSPTATTSSADLAAVKQAIGLIRNGRTNDASEIEKTIADPSARKLVEWILLRSDDNDVDFARYNAFIVANPGWPSIVTLRRRAEALLWQERASPAIVRAFFATTKPMSPKGRFALARALLMEGDRAGAQLYAGEAWRTDAFSRDVESVAQELFSDLISRADDKARMDKRLYASDSEAALRAAQRLGGAEPAIARARIAVTEKSAKAEALLDAVPAEGRRDAGYIFSRAQWLRRNDEIAEAGRLILTAPRDPARLQDVDEWWVERRLIARKLLDIGDARTAYLVVRDAAPPTKDNYRAEHEFTAGWIALRFLGDAATASHHFARVAQGATSPITLSRAGYWQGRAAEAANRPTEARTHYQAAARYGTAYYGQLARARLGLGEIALAPAPTPAADQRIALSRLEVVRAAEILYAIDERDHLVPIMADLADKTADAGALAVLAELAAKNGDARSVLLVGKTALGRGFTFDHYAFPTMGLPRYAPIGPAVESPIVYAIARQESAFNPKTVSSANALGLMQVTPEAGRYVAKKFGIAFDQKRLLHDPVYNVQVGSAELGDVIDRYRGSYILAFAAYNAGPGRVKEWLGRYGDPRESGVDAVDWVERIPFSETRNYVQRVMENVQVYRARFGGGSRLMIEADLRRGAGED